MKYIVDFKQDVTQDQIDQYIEVNLGTLIKVWNKFERIKLIEFPAHPPVTEIIESVVEDSQELLTPLGSSVCEFNPHFGYDLVPGLPTIEFNTNDQKDWWKNAVMSNPELHEETKTISRKGQNVTVYVMDSGINSSHPDFVDTNILDVYTVTPDDYSDQSGHGTAIASLIAGKTCGITQATIKNVKIFRPDRGTLLSEFMDAIDAITIDNNFSQWSIVNCSWAIDKNDWIEARLNELNQLGILIVASAGNNGTSIQNVTPASMPQAYVIGSVGIELEPSNFSNYTGSSTISYTANETNYGKLDAWAPGELIWAARADDEYGFVAGTSASAAIASAVFAYTLSDYVTGSGDKSPMYRTISGPDTPAGYHVVFGMHGVVELSDPKYADSINRLIGIMNRSWLDVSGWDSTTDVVTWVLKPTLAASIGARVFNAYRTAGVEFIDELPDNFYITTCGSLAYENLEDHQLPAGDETFKTYKSRIRVSYKESDFVEEKLITIHIINDNYEPENGDEEINIRLQFNVCDPGGLNGTVQECPILGEGEPNCTDNCGGLTCCDQIAKESDCVCRE